MKEGVIGKTYRYRTDAGTCILFGYTVFNENGAINDCRIYFNFLMPSELLEMRRFEGRLVECSNLLYNFGINSITYLCTYISGRRRVSV